MKRDLDRLREAFDLVVIGAGVYGAAIAWDATLRGLRVALIDRAASAAAPLNNARRRTAASELQGPADERAIRLERRALCSSPPLVQPCLRSPALARCTATVFPTAYSRLLTARGLSERGVDPASTLSGRILGRDAYLAHDPIPMPARHRRRGLADPDEPC